MHYVMGICYARHINTPSIILTLVINIGFEVYFRGLKKCLDNSIFIKVSIETLHIIYIILIDFCMSLKFDFMISVMTFHHSLI